jgi:L-2-hydroxycarboxylate dehydrogenase (NAD+)
MPDETPRVTASQLAAFIARAFTAAGLPELDAEQVAGLMVEADLRGSDTHGVIRLPLYVRRIRAGGVNARPNIRVVSDRPSAALIDGDNGMGHLVMKRAAELAIEKAKATGIGWVGARMSNHAGPAALYATRPLKHDMIGLYFAMGSNNHLPAWGSSENLLGAGRAGDCSGYVADRCRLRQSAAQGAARRSDAGRLDDRQGWQAFDRSEARR